MQSNASVAGAEAGGIDAIVLGAGASGLRAALELRRAKRTVVVLEARDRVGGRTLSETINGARFDLGGQWLGPDQHRVHRLTRELGLRTFATFHEGRKVLELDGKISSYSGTIPKLPIASLIETELALRRINRLVEATPVTDPRTRPNAAALDAMTLGEWTRAHIRSTKVRRILASAVQVIFGCEPDEISMLHVLTYCKSGVSFQKLIDIPGGAQQDRWVDGAQALSLGMARELGDAVKLEQFAYAVEQDGRGVTVHTQKGSFTARRLIVAMAPPLAGRLRYSPALPARRDQLTQRMPMGATMKVMAVYRRPFWRDKGFSGEVVSDDGLISLAFDNTDASGNVSALLGFVVGANARRWGAVSAEERQRAVLRAFAKWFGPDALEPIGYHEKDWTADPLAGGCPIAIMSPRGWTDGGDVLRAPCGRIHWAGTETALEWMGFIEGALDAGERAAHEVLTALRV